MKITIYPSGSFLVNTYLVWDEESKEAMVVDPGSREAVEELRDEIDRNELVVKYILNTHEHPDHTAANVWAKLEFPEAKLIMHEEAAKYLNFWIESEIGRMAGAEYSPPPDETLSEGSKFALGNVIFQVLHTPGHSPGSIVVFDSGKKFALVGDLIFKGSIGRYDLPMSNYNDLKKSILKVLNVLEGDTVLFPGHGEKTTISEELKNNPFIAELVG
ncbi:Glyoxylase, beta-lactamase superfamily II [Desulfurobacterium pacificum]|uniref:Glyoxylase, beta-lactamase superfamily II n=1 Tax=Desulfurobacterium pacificum TaxID=240166 RepID=A0ABY1NCU5_9BACT|nr:MBL fold metallo-hydrolase [Desulfurobacterium pacificum]SMP06606.1 Glyoxylase, beta-lactamase superfamily II [Desulfurobacterium pacificum]